MCAQLPPTPWRTANAPDRENVLSRYSTRTAHRRKRKSNVARRIVTLLTAVTGLSGTVYPPGTKAAVTGRGASVDAFVNGDWLPLAWWEFSEGDAEDLRRS